MIQRSDLKRLQPILEASADAVLLVDADGIILEANDRVEELLGYSPEELQGEPVELLVPEPLRDRHHSLRERYVDDPQQRPMGANIDLEARTADGEILPVDISLSPFEVGGHLVICTAIRDISQEALLRQQYQSILQAVPDAIIVADPETGEILEVNNQVSELFGYDPANLVGESQTILHPTDEADRYRELFERHVSSGQALYTAFPDGSDIEIETAAGDRVPVEINAKVFEQHNTQRIVGVFRDISERRRYERRLEQEHERLQQMLDAIPVPLALAELRDGDAIVSWINDEFEDRFGLTRGELIGADIDQYIADEETAAEAKTINRRLERGEPVRREIRRTTASGEHRTFLLVATPLITDEQIEVVGAYIDISEQQRTLRKRKLLSEVSQQIGEADGFDEGIQHILTAICRHTSWQYGEVWIPDEHADRLVFGGGYTMDPALEGFLEASEKYTFKVGEGIPGQVYERGEPDWIPTVSEPEQGPFIRKTVAESAGLQTTLAIPLIAADGEVLAVFMFFLDESRQRDDELVEDVTDVISQLGGLAVQKQAEELIRRRNEQLEDFAGVISHDLRNPLAVAVGTVELIREDPDAEYIDSLENALHRMEELIDDLLALAKEGTPIDETKPVDLAQCVERSWGNVDTEQATLQVATSKHILADQNRLEQLLENLFRNAVEHGGASATVTVGELDTGFFVEDDGPGIDPADRADLFRPGYTTSEAGTGFGLAIVREIVDAHRWVIDVAEGTDGGARFEITEVEPVEDND